MKKIIDLNILLTVATLNICHKMGGSSYNCLSTNRNLDAVIAIWLGLFVCINHVYTAACVTIIQIIISHYLGITVL